MVFAISINRIAAEIGYLHYLFIRLRSKAVTSIAMNEKAMTIHTQGEIPAVQGKGSFPFGIPFGGVAVPDSEPEVP